MVRKKNRAMFEEEGGEKANLKTGNNITLFEHEGALFLKVEFRPPTKSTDAS